MYEVVNEKPVATFYYKGTHSHPVRRTILIIESNKKYIRGYELREGSIQRKLKSAPVKTYTMSKIAKWSQLGRRKHRKPGPNITSLKRMELLDLLKIGV